MYSNNGSIGYVAFITGGWNTLTSVELYSPNGDCQHQLAPLPRDLAGHVLAFHGNDIIACAGKLGGKKYFSQLPRSSTFTFYLGGK